jgi:predicted RNA-binding Zn-ribbon protein involved in translation (DUF1610 family)
MLAKDWQDTDNSRDNWEEKLREGFTRMRCPRCGGNIYLERDSGDWYEHCLQCGYTSDLQVIVEVREKVSEGNFGQVGGKCPN